MRVFVTGSTGVIGSRVVPLLVAAGHEVTAVSRTAEKQAALASMGANPAHIDLFAAGDVRRAVAGHNLIINLATHVPSGPGMFLPGAWRENDRVRRLVSANLVEAAKAAGVERYVQESFALIYPDSGDDWIDERTPIRPARYNRSVVAAERAAARFARTGRAGVVLRFAAFYGPDSGQTRDLIAYVRRGWAPIPGSPGSFFSSVSHDDAALAVIAALNAPSGVYNVTDDEPLRRREFFDTLAAVLGAGPPRIAPAWTAPLMGSLGEVLARSLRPSNRKLREASGWEPRYPSVREGWPAVIKALEEGVS